MSEYRTVHVDREYINASDNREIFDVELIKDNEGVLTLGVTFATPDDYSNFEGEIK